MLTISKPLSSGQAQAYHRLEFTADSQNYYKQGGAVQGEWQGELAKAFALAGAPVDERHFALLTEGKNPQTEEQVVGRKPGKEQGKAEETTGKGEAAATEAAKQKAEQAEVKVPATAALARASSEAASPKAEEQTAKREALAATPAVEHRAGWDATFSAPKSVSLTALVGGDERVREAHREAVTAALAELERYTQGRIGGNHPGETTGRFIAAKFEHDTARPVDGYAAPQLHTHAVIFNMTQLDDGRMRALQPKSMFDSQSYVTAVYQAELTFRLRELGYGLMVGRSGAPEIKGYTQEYLDASSLRSQQIREQLAQSGYQGPAAAQIAAHATRDSKQLLSPEEVLAAHRQLAAEFGNQATTVVAEARERAQSQTQAHNQAQGRAGTAEGKPEQPEANSRAQAAVSYAKEHIFEREAVADRRGILRDALRHGMGEVRPGEVQAEFERRQAQGEFRRAGSRVYDTDLRFTTPATIAAERANIAHMRAGQGAVEPMMTAKLAEEHAAMRTFLNKAQRTVIEEVLTSRDRIHGLQGLAGTGKTTTLESIRKGAEQSGYAVEGFAPTSKAAAQLREAGISAGTLQGFLACGNQGQADPASKHLYMLDESSFASTRQMRAFLDKLGPKDRVLVIGDTGQHQGVDAGRPFEQMQQAGMRTSQLDQIMRQRDPELRKAVEHLAKGETSKGVAMLSEQGRVKEVADAKERIAAIVKDYAANPKNTIIVSPDNASRREINQAVRAELQATGAVKKDGKEFSTLITRNDMTGADRAWAARYAEGDVLLYSRGSKETGLERGSYATVTGVNAAKNEITVRGDDGQSVTYDPARLRGVTAYRELPRSLATGDRIQFTAGNEKLGVANRDLATITAIEPGKMTVRMDGKEKRSLSFDPDKMRHIDHGYAVTSHSSQGTTANRVLVNIDTEAPRSLINTRLAYVAVSRAAGDARIYTNRADDLHQKLATENTKTVAVKYDAKAREQAHAGYLGPKRGSEEPMPLSRTAELCHAVAMLGGEEARIGANLLEHQGRITVEPDRERRLAAMARDYTAAPEKAVAVVPSAAERQLLNEAIRGELRRTGALGPDDRTVPVLVERQINRRNAGAYEVGDRIEFRAGSIERGIQPNSGATVLAVNTGRNQLTIQKQDGELATYNPSSLKATRQSSVYRQESRDLEVGDRIRVTVDHKPSGIRAGDLATVEAIRGIGALQVRLDSGKLAELEPAQARHIEYGYAVESGHRVKADRLLASVESPAQLAPESPLYKAIAISGDTKFYASDRTALYEARTPDEIERFLARTADTQQVVAPDPLRAPLDRVLGQANAQQFEWVAQTGTIQTYQNQETGRNLHIDGVTGQFYDQARNPIGRDAALAHALSDGPTQAKQESNAEDIGPILSQNQPSHGHRLRM